MIYLKKFENHEAYEAATLTLPNVSLCQQENDVHYNPYVPEPEYVDLGLSVKWRKHPIGMSTDTDIENVLYFQWGDTEGHVASDNSKTYDWAHAPFNNGNSDFDSAYWTSVSASVLDGKILRPQYDAAYTNLGEGWRMPTKEEYIELINNAVRVDETIGSVKGVRFTSKINGNSIFIPFIGDRKNNSINNVGEYYHLWSSTYTMPSFSQEFARTIDGFVNGFRLQYYGHAVFGVTV